MSKVYGEITAENIWFHMKGEDISNYLAYLCYYCGFVRLDKMKYQKRSREREE